MKHYTGNQEVWTRQELRIPKLVKRRLVARAKILRRSQNQLVVTILEQYFRDLDEGKILENED